MSEESTSLGSDSTFFGIQFLGPKAQRGEGWYTGESTRLEWVLMGDVDQVEVGSGLGDVR